ncbi:glycosyltransferase family 39 protein [Candidatus Microgenomates bacterium]|nr:glycosyltransferase family 39 protein [Candidatus Microgenomates bacterium]
MKKLLLIAILVLAFILRFYQLGSLPALNADEAAIGYNAYSLIQTGKDEHGNSWPIHFQSFNDYKPGLYFYVVLPFVKVLGLNELAVRIPGALAGVLTVLIVYLLVKQLFNKKEFALVAAFLLAISPWHIQFSRGGWEVNFATFLITTGIWLFIKSVDEKLNLKFLLGSVLLFVASLYTYHAARVIVPLMGLGLLVIYKKEIFVKNLKKLLIATVLGIVLLVPLGLDLAKPAISSRAAGVGLFADSGPLSRIEEQRTEHGNFNSPIAKVLHNKVVNYGLAFAYNWSRHFWGEFLFLSGDIIQRNRVPETGQLYLIELPFVLIGLYKIITDSKDLEKRKRWSIIVWWLIIAPIAAGLTFQAPHALRAENMVIPLEIISAYGLIQILIYIKKTKIKSFLIGGYIALSVLMVWSVARYLHMYYVHMAKEYPYSSQYGVKELVDYVSKNQNEYQKILVTDRYDQPYILFLFYTKYSPTKFQSEHLLTGRDSFGFSTVNHFDKYYFTSIKFDEAQPNNPNSLLIGTDGEIPDEANIVKNIYGTNGYLYFQIVRN